MKPAKENPLNSPARKGKPRQTARKDAWDLFMLGWSTALLGVSCAWVLAAEPEWAKLALGDGFLASWGPKPLLAGFSLLAAIGAAGGTRAIGALLSPRTSREAERLSLEMAPKNPVEKAGFTPSDRAA